MTLKAIRLHERDLAMLTDVAEVGILDAPTLWQRHFPADRTGKACQRRLRLLCAHDLLLPICVTVAFAHKHEGRPQRIFRLTPRGAEVLGELTGRRDFHYSRKEPRPETLLHRLGMAKLRLIVNDACVLQKFPAPQWINEYDTVRGVSPEAKLSERFVLCEKLTTSEGHTVSCWPDASCLLRIPNPSSNGTTNLIIYWEYDRSTETLSQVAGKIPGYHVLLANLGHQKHWPKADGLAVRVFFVLQSLERLRNVGETIATIPGAEYVRLALLHEIAPQRFFTDPIWKTTVGEARPILRGVHDRGMTRATFKL